MLMADRYLRLRLLISLIFFISAYSPLMVIVAIQQMDFSKTLWLAFSKVSIILLMVAVISSIIVLLVVRSIKGGLNVNIIKASNKSGDMFGYTIPYMLSFMRVDFCDLKTILSIALFMLVLFVMAHRTQTVFINPVLAIFGYMLIDCTFRCNDKEIQAMVISKEPISSGETLCLDNLSPYLYICSNSNYRSND